MQAMKLRQCDRIAEAENLPLSPIKSGKQVVSSARGLLLQRIVDGFK